MNDFYGDMRKIASNLLGEFNQGVIRYVEMTPGIGPPDDPGLPQETFHPINGVARGVKLRYIDGTHIVASDLQITMPGDTVVPKMEGFVQIDGTKHKIVKIIPKPAAGPPVAYTIIVRK